MRWALGTSGAPGYGASLYGRESRDSVAEIEAALGIPLAPGALTASGPEEPSARSAAAVMTTAAALA